jgi:hypothetical protein
MRAVVLLLLLGVAAIVNAQYFPGQQPGVGGTGFPVPSWLKGSRTVTGYVGNLEADRILVRTLDQGNVLCHIDDKTKVHVDKTPMSIKDLREGDAIAVKIKDVKNLGPYAQEIMPHPDVLYRKEHGDKADPPREATPLPETPLPPVQRETRMTAPPTAPPTVPPVDARQQPTSHAASSSAAAPQTVPALPRGQRGIQGTIVALNESSGEATLQTEAGEKRTVLVTSVTRIIKAGTRDEIMQEVRVGDRVAIMGDSLDSGVYVAREVLVNRAAESATSAQPQESMSEKPAKAEKSAPLSGNFTGIVESVAVDSLKVQAGGISRIVIVTPITTIKKYNSDTPLAGLRKGDELKITGDVLDSGETMAREITVTKSGTSQ